MFYILVLFGTGVLIKPGIRVHSELSERAVYRHFLASLIVGIVGYDFLFFTYSSITPTPLSRACRFFSGPDGPLGPRQTSFSPIENAIAKVWVFAGLPGPSGPSVCLVCLPVIPTYVVNKKKEKKVYNITLSRR